MRVQEQFIIPGLGVVILLSAFALGAPLAYMIILGVLGLAAAGTYYAPQAVQVETRIVIAVLGLITLFVYFSSLGFWLALLAFGTIGALQIRYRDTLQRSPATVAWLNKALGKRGPADAQTGDGDGDGEAALAGLASVLQGKVTIAAIGAAVLGVVVLLSPFLPWVVYSINYGGETVSESFSGLRTADLLREQYGGTVPNLILGVGIVLALLSIASIVLPRVAPIIVGVAGMLLTLGAFIYTYAGFNGDSAGAGFSEVGTTTFPHIGFFVIGGSFLLVTVLHIIPGAYKSKDKGTTDG